MTSHFIKVPPQDMDYITLSPGRFILFFPTDIHQPEVFTGEPALVKKLVVKVINPSGHPILLKEIRPPAV
jgi:YhcH/YjgK/YiaL family protein